MRPEIFKTKVTRLRPGLYGCRVLFAEDDTVFAELRVPKNQIGDAIRDVGMKKLKAELEKCVCLCANCHRKVHAGIFVL